MNELTHLDFANRDNSSLIFTTGNRPVCKNVKPPAQFISKPALSKSGGYRSRLSAPEQVRNTFKRVKVMEMVSSRFY
jgi:hypothetical protein